MRMTIRPGVMLRGYFVEHQVSGLDTVWRWDVDDDDAVYSGMAGTQAEAFRQAAAAVEQASPVMVARTEGVTAGLDAMRARAEAAEARAAAAEDVVADLVRLFGWSDSSVLHAALHVENAVHNMRADASTARHFAAAAEARAAQAQADARLMAGLAFASFVERTSFSPEIIEASLLDALEGASDHTATVSDADLVAAVRRILATAGTT